MIKISQLTLFSLSLFAIVACTRGQAQEDVKSNQAVWYGALDAGQRVFRFVIRTNKTDDGKPSEIGRASCRERV